MTHRRSIPGQPRRTLEKVALILALTLFVVPPLFAGGAKEQKPTTLTKMTWISPRGTLEVMDDYDLWVSIDMGYFKEMGLDIVMEPGPIEAFSTTRFVDQGKADVGCPSAGILTASIDTGMNIIGAYEEMIGQVFDFAVRKDSPIQSVQDLAGKTISLGSAGWQVIVDPILVEIGVDPKTVKYVTVGAEWGQAVAAGKADAALTWEALRAQWDAQGLNLRYFIGQEFSKMPSNVYAVRKADLKDPAKRALAVKFLRGHAMGMHFARFNPRAAAQMVYSRFPAIREQMKPELALASMQQLHWAYIAAARAGHGYGWFNLDSWKTYLDIIYKLGQIKKLPAVEDVVTNDLVKEVNDFDHARVERDAKNFKLDDTWKNVPVVGDW